MSNAGEISKQVELESERRSRLAVPAFAGGFLYLLSGIITHATLTGAPTVGVLQGLAPALSGVAQPTESPRTAEIKYISHHALNLIIGSVLAAIAVLALMLILLLLVEATVFRRPESWKPARMLVLSGGIALAVVSVGHQIVSAVETHNFAVGHDFSIHAADNALTKGTANTIINYVDLIAGLSFAAGMIATSLNAMRVGLLPRWMGFLGMLVGVLIFLPLGGATLEIVPAFWMVMMGILLSGKWPNQEPAAWRAGEARPWPSRAQMRAEAGSANGKPALSTGAGDVTPPPAQPVLSSRKRRRKRGAGN